MKYLLILLFIPLALTAQEKQPAEGLLPHDELAKILEQQEKVLQELRSIKRDMITLKSEMDAMNRRMSLILSEQEGTAASFEDLLQDDPELAMEKIISFFENQKFETVFDRGIEFSTTIPEHEKAAMAFLLAEASFLRVNKGDYEKTIAWRKENEDRLYSVFRNRAAKNLLSEREIKSTLAGKNRRDVRMITGVDTVEEGEAFQLGQFNVTIDFDNGRADAIDIEPASD